MLVHQPRVGSELKLVPNSFESCMCHISKTIFKITLNFLFFSGGWGGVIWPVLKAKVCMLFSTRVLGVFKLSDKFRGIEHA